MFNTLSRYQAKLLGILRIVTGLLFLGHGLVKMFGFPPGAMPGQVPMLGLLGVAAVIELLAGTLILVGLFTRIAAFIASGQMAIAYWMFHAPNSIYPIVNMGEVAILFCFIFLYLAAAGPGAYSLDARRRPRK